MEYINDTATLPVPFNLMPTFKTLAHAFRYTWVRCCSCLKRSEPERMSHPGRIKDMEMYASSRGFVSYISILTITKFNEESCNYQ